MTQFLCRMMAFLFEEQCLLFNKLFCGLEEGTKKAGLVPALAIKA